MTILTLLVAFLFGNPTTAKVHDFHLSKTTINYDTEERAIQISSSIFIDDLELALKDLGYDSLKICTRFEKENVEDLMFAYFREHLKIEIDGSKVALSFLGKEQSDDLMAVWCYLEAFEIDAFQEISVSNTILTQQFDDQKNITMVQVDKERIGQILFTVDHTQENIEN